MIDLPWWGAALTVVAVSVLVVVGEFIAGYVFWRITGIDHLEAERWRHDD